MEENKIMSTTELDWTSNKVNVLNMEMLRQTRHPKNGAGEPLGGIYHTDFIDAVLERANNHGLNIGIWEIFAAESGNRNLPGVIRDDDLEKIYGINNIKAQQLNRIYVNARITNYDDDNYTTNIAIAYHQKGIQVAVGSNVKICHNQMVLGTKDFYTATYSDRGTGKVSRKDSPDPRKVIDLVDGYFDKIGDRVYEQRKLIEKMKEVELTTEQIYIFIGMLQCMRVAIDTKQERIRQQGVYPLGNGEINKFTEEIMLRKYDNKVVTLWDMYDASTNLYKAKSMEIPNILPQSYAMAEFIENWEIKPDTKSYIIEAPRPLQIETL